MLRYSIYSKEKITIKYFNIILCSKVTFVIPIRSNNIHRDLMKPSKTLRCFLMSLFSIIYVLRTYLYICQMSVCDCFHCTRIELTVRVKAKRITIMYNSLFLTFFSCKKVFYKSLIVISIACVYKALSCNRKNVGMYIKFLRSLVCELRWVEQKTL